MSFFKKSVIWLCTSNPDLIPIKKLVVLLVQVSLNIAQKTVIKKLTIHSLLIHVFYLYDKGAICKCSIYKIILILTAI